MRARPLANPPNRFESRTVDYAPALQGFDGAPPTTQVAIYEDHTRKIVATNDSPDLGFGFSVNPYRGCTHACAYCYARPSHEYLGFGAGTDFDTKIVVKRDAAKLLRAAFDKPSWNGDLVMFSGVTDCYQPIESTLQLTRACLEVCLEYKNPVAIITKAPLVERDADLLAELHAVAGARVTVSIPFWNADTARAIEPFVATPERRVRTIATLAARGIPVGVNVAPIIPGLNDQDLAQVLGAARAAGATTANFTLLRLPGAVKDVFTERLTAKLPLAADKVLHRIRETRAGKLNDARFSIRQRGEGEYAQSIATLFEAVKRKLGYPDVDVIPPRDSTFARPPSGQLTLF